MKLIKHHGLLSIKLPLAFNAFEGSWLAMAIGIIACELAYQFLNAVLVVFM